MTARQAAGEVAAAGSVAHMPADLAKVEARLAMVAAERVRVEGAMAQPASGPWAGVAMVGVAAVEVAMAVGATESVVRAVRALEGGGGVAQEARMAGAVACVAQAPVAQERAGGRGASMEEVGRLDFVGTALLAVALVVGVVMVGAAAVVVATAEEA